MRFRSTRRSSDPEPRLAAMTMVRDERVMLPRWLAHYGRECGTDHLYVIDDNTSDGSTEDLPCSVIRIPSWGNKHFEQTRMRMVSRIAAGLLEAYDAVLFADADEFLVADPDRHEGLVDLLAKRPDVPVLGAQALNVVHDPQREPSLDPDRPVLGQRRWAKFIPLMCKPALKRTTAPWVAGSHGMTIPFEIDPDLYLFHLKFAERDHLRVTGDHRKTLADSEGRAAATTWQFAGDDLVDLLDEITHGVDPAAVAPYRTRPQVLSDIVREGEGGHFRAHGRRQHNAMRNQPMVSIPERFWGVV
ncbi:glycosyltransferase family 2 protein [Nocardioides sp.]|uniref:glycosyltransferase family 2 protein n=1 Tax=Nocardioides sp. TaxID=35761 RepID=UPI002ED52283